MAKITFSMPEEILLILDTKRGKVSRSKAIRNALCYLIAHDYLGNVIDIPKKN